jgi:hypothetical protein
MASKLQNLVISCTYKNFFESVKCGIDYKKKNAILMKFTAFSVSRFE